MRVMVTGANGFVGAALARTLAVAGHAVRAVVRRPARLQHGIDVRTVGDIAAAPDFAELFEGIEAVVHCAARVHRMDQRGTDALEVYLRDNTEATRSLATEAAAAGVRRFVFLSSVKANGEETDTPYTEDRPPTPEDAYGISKWRAELALADVSHDTGMETVVLRPPLVYGPGVGANFRALLRLADTPLPLPLGVLDGNARSLVYLGNLIDAIGRALDHPAAAGRTYLVRDGEDVSTAGLIRRLRRALGRPARLVRVPQGALEAAARTLGRGTVMRRVAGSLALDDSRIRAELGWQPPFTLDQGLAATAAWYRTDGARK